MSSRASTLPRSGPSRSTPAWTRRMPNGRRWSLPWPNSSPRRRLSLIGRAGALPVYRGRRVKLNVPGATLYYEVRGSGPVLLMMPGGPADATTFRRMEERLAADYTVVTYDPRGLSHSTEHEPLDDSRMVEIYADDAHRLLAAVGGGKADVF